MNSSLGRAGALIQDMQRPAGELSAASNAANAITPTKDEANLALGGDNVAHLEYAGAVFSCGANDDVHKIGCRPYDFVVCDHLIFDILTRTAYEECL